MKLVAKAKPVKIRIKSGGEEHSSLDSLKKNFCIDDVKELLDGRLSRWLRQQNEILLAEEIDKFEDQDLNSDDKCLEFIKLLFGKELNTIEITSLFDLAKYWCIEDTKYKCNGESLFKQRLLEYNLEAAKYAYKNQLFPEEPWINIFTIFRNSKDAEYLYILGKLLFDGYGGSKDIENGYKLIKEAATYGWEEACKFISDKIYEKNRHRFNLVNKTKLKKLFLDPWPNIPNRKNALKHATNDDERTIISFLISCRELYIVIDWSSTKDLIIKAKELLNDYEKGIIGHEIIFIYAILDLDFYKRITVENKASLKTIQNDYPPAKYLLNSGIDIQFDMNFMRLNFKNKLKHIVQHLFDFD